MVEPRIVAPVVVGSIPIIHPIASLSSLLSLRYLPDPSFGVAIAFARFADGERSSGPLGKFPFLALVMCRQAPICSGIALASTGRDS